MTQYLCKKNELTNIIIAGVNSAIFNYSSIKLLYNYHHIFWKLSEFSV